jgi:nucleoside-diphosphate-sugar epimerase
LKALQNEKILITGPTGQIAFPMAMELARTNEVWGIARFKDQSKRANLEALGIKTCAVDLANPDFQELPGDFSYVIHLAAFIGRSANFDRALTVNAEGTGLLMEHCRKARAFFSMSSCSIYAAPQDPRHAVKESEALSGEALPYSPTYIASKTGQEAVARLCARLFNLPTTIGRMNVSYGPNGGLPAYQFDAMLAGQPVQVLADRTSVCSPIYQDDIVSQVSDMLRAASVPATVVNWGGDEAVDVEMYCSYMAGIAGIEARFEHVRDGIRHTVTDNTRRREMAGECRVSWREGMRRMIAARHPEMKLKAQGSG